MTESIPPSGTTEQATPETDPYRYPPDEMVSLPFGVSFTQAVILIVWGGAVIDLLLNGVIETPIPYNYHTIVALVHVTAAVLILQRSYTLGIELMGELADLADRDRGPLAIESDEITGNEIRLTFLDALNRGFNPYVIVGGGVVMIVLGVVGASLLDLFSLIPYWIVGLLFFAAHGVYLGPLVTAVYLLHQSVTKYIVDIDVLSPDGVGGYRTVGDVIVSFATYGIILLTLDFLVASAVRFLDRPFLELVVGGVYVGWLLLVLTLIVGGIVAIRRRLLAIRDAKVDQLRERFTQTEQEYWSKQAEGGDVTEEALDMMTKRSMFRELSDMSLWPINLLALVKLGFSTGTSLFVFALDQGLVSLPI